ncbi:hypothetical protein E0Z10_g9930 [Xylaria hypoxylon]|uniref:F-box domain-containing protein n=1 Tax=Xylaria hypoxylon TaxID=37992 RepID=A0A4Z0YMF3_9PEZI|nr:hypothetical protein E0Z10_g9930 [Xylaria hypoxylon]
MVTPMKYQTLRMTRDIVDPQAETYFPEGIANICAHTRHVKVDSDLNAEHVKNLLDKIERLSSVSWRYVQDDLCKGEFWVPTDILPPQYIQSSMVKLYIEDLPLRDFRSEKNNPYLKAIPTWILVSLKMATPTPPLTARVESLKGLLLNSLRLETFWYDDRGQGTQFELSGSERLPPFEELRLRSYDWRHSSATVRQHWDFSKIRHLELVDVPLGPFLASVSFPDFRHLEILRLDDSSMFLPDIRRDTTRGQYVLIKQTQALVDLQITCATQSFPVDGISRHAQSLQKLRFRDYTGFEDEHRRCPTMKIEDLDILSQKLVNLRTLELDMDERCCEPDHFLRTLCNFRQLNTLTLHTQTVLNPLEDIETNVDLDHERATHIFSLLVQGKRPASWRSITINVGGWKPIMVRRLSASWRELHNLGLCAERCFIMERQEDGALAMREKLPARESRLSHA